MLHSATVELRPPLNDYIICQCAKYSGNTLVRYNITVGIFHLNYFVIEVVNKHLSF